MAKYSIVAGIKIATDFVPETFGRLTTIGPVFRLSSKGDGSRPFQVCQCDCGNVITTKVRYLHSGDTKSCGCLHNEVAANRNRQHGKSTTPEYRSWNAARIRCTNANDATYKEYGARGIRMCDRWQEPNGQGFRNFLADMGPRPTIKHSLDRIDVNGNYEPGNCRWATNTEQCRNTRRNINITYNGKTQCLTAWAEEYGISRANLEGRLHRGWPIEKALITPKIKTGSKSKWYKKSM